MARAGTAKGGSASIPTADHTNEVSPGRILARLLDESWLTFWRRRRHYRKAGGAGPVHKLRVAARRLLTHMDLLVGMDSDGDLREGLAALQKQFAAMGLLRDAQVQLHELNHLSLSKGKRRTLRRVLKKRERRLGREVLAAMVEFEAQ